MNEQIANQHVTESGDPRDRISNQIPTKQERQNFSDAHAEGLHDEAPREFCPECSTN